MEPGTYDRSEYLAKQVLHSWKFAQAQTPHLFESSNFPIRVETTQDLYQILDSMQDFRFDRYMTELGGLTDVEIEFIVDVLIEHCLFQKAVLPNRTPNLSLATILAHFAIFKKLEATNRTKRILELGPGCGYLSLFLKRFAKFSKFVQIESTQSFYILQSLLSRYLFGAAFREHAHLDLANLGRSVMPATDNPDRVGVPPYFRGVEELIGLDFESPNMVEHYPWWKIGMVHEQEFDLVTSNANLMEFQPEALRAYLELIRKTMVADGVVIAQCLGSPRRMELKTLFQCICDARLAVVMMVPDGPCLRGKKFVVGNAIFVGEGHPLFAEHYSDQLRVPKIPNGVDLVDSVFFREKTNGRHLSKADLAARTAEKLGERLNVNVGVVDI